MRHKYKNIHHKKVWAKPQGEIRERSEPNEGFANP
jgi:hypothetical protein